ncbi:response regulator [Nocardia suismassiliense]|uniref:Response regulator n=1 Tax=Nocardia suismassiliense TaxID=2077092 RepID=A0ABW6QQB2_9NOCA
MLIHPTLDLWQPRGFGPALLLALIVALGMWVRSRRRLIDALARQVEHLRIERELREEAARLAERSVIAAEMHDVLAHRLSLLALHSGVLATRTDTLPAPVVERLGLLRSTSTAALNELREVLGALHQTGAAPELAPALQELDDVVDQARAAGQDVESSTVGNPAQAPLAHRLAVYRIVREALSNARKHAGDAAIVIRVAYTDLTTTVDVTNTAGAQGYPVVSSGFGLIGLRERVAALVRLGLSDLLGTDPGIEVVAQAAEGLQAIEQATAHRIDVALMDVRMPRMDGITAITRLRALPHPPRIITLTTFDLDEYVYNALAAGADGFLLKDTDPAEILRAVHLVAAGSAMLHPVAARRLIDRYHHTARPRAAAAQQRIDRLTPREREVLALLAEGATNADIAAALGMRESTVKAHVSRILTALEVTNGSGPHCSPVTYPPLEGRFRRLGVWWGTCRVVAFM